jgi:alkylated DNA repair dioxygenase AlkB
VQKIAVLRETMTDETGSARVPDVDRENVASSQVRAEHVDLPDAAVVLYREVFGSEERRALFDALLLQTCWEQHVITVYGRRLPAPRLSAWYGDCGAAYSYSGIRLAPAPWTDTLLGIKQRAERLARVRFNSVLLNLYRDGRDSVGWHSDAEPDLGPNPVIASVSFGAARRFLLEHKARRLRVALVLDSGSVLVMGGATQRHWRHQLPKSSRPVAPRINLSFRVVGMDRADRTAVPSAK